MLSRPKGSDNPGRSESQNELTITPYSRKKTACLIIIATALLLSLLPILLASPFARPMEDDYSFGKFVRQMGIGGVMKTVTSLWSGFQGSFFGSVLMSMQPVSLFGAGAYGAVGFVLLGLLAAGIFALTFAALKKIAEVSERMIIAATALFCCAQYIPYISQAFFWWNGAIYYMGTFSIMLISLSCMLRLRTQDKRFWVFFAKTAIICLLEFLLGGANFVVALLNLLINIAIFTISLFGKFIRLPTADRRRRAAHGLFTLFALSGLLLSVLAPGNAIRQAYFEHLSILETVRLSFIQAARDIITFSKLPLWLAALALVPLFISITRRSLFRFPLPFLALVASFLLLAAMNAPPYYAVGERTYGRIININYCAFVLLVFINIFYTTGWAVRRFGGRFTAPQRGSHPAFGAALLILLFGSAVLSSIRQTTGFLCLRELYRGTPQAYAAIYAKQYDILNDPEVEVAVIPLQTVYVEVFDRVNNSDDPAAWFNTSAAEFFGKRLVAESDDENYTLPEMLPAELEFTFESVTVSLEGYGYLNTPLIPIRALAYALRDTAYTFGVETLPDGKTIIITAGERYVTPPETPEPRPLDAVRDFDIRIGGRVYVRSGYVIGSEQYFSHSQLRQLLTFL